MNGRIDPWFHIQGKPNGSHCMDCGANTSMLHEFYMLKDDVWLSIVPGGDGMLCIGDAERRLCRKLNSLDFDPQWADLPGQKSARLRDRLTRRTRVQISA